jgi:hypothetical protein
MIRKQLLCVALALLGLVSGGVVVPAAEDVLTVVPKDALGFVVATDIGPTHGKALELAKTLQLPARITKAMEKQLNRPLQGVDEHGSVAIAAIVDRQTPGAPVAVAFVPVTDYLALIKQLGADDAEAEIAEVVVANNESLIAKKGGYAVLTRRGNRQILEQVLAATGSVAADMAPLKEQMAACDIYAVATPGGIKMAQQGILFGLAAGKAKIAEEGGPQAEMALRGIKIYEELFKAMDKEVTHCAVGVQFQEDGGLHIVSRTLLAPGGTIAKLAKTVEEPTGDLLAGLPRKPFMFAGGGLYPESWAKELTGLALDFMTIYFGADSLTDKQETDLTKLMARSVKGMRSMAMLMGVGGPDESLYSSMLVSIEVKDSRRYLANYTRLVRKMSKIGKEADIPFFSYDVKRMEIEGAKGLKLSIDIGSMMGDFGDPKAQKAIESMIGTSGNLDVYLAAADSDTVVAAYVSKQRLAEALKMAKDADSQLSRDPSIVKAAAALPSGAQWIAFWSPQGTVEFVANMITKIKPEVGAKIPEFPQTTPVAFAERLSPEAVDIDVVVPADVLKAIPEFIKSVKAKNAAP